MRFVKYNWGTHCCGLPSGLHTIEMNKHDVSRVGLQGPKQYENTSIFSKIIALYFTLERAQNTEMSIIVILTVC